MLTPDVRKALNAIDHLAGELGEYTLETLGHPPPHVGAIHGWTQEIRQALAPKVHGGLECGCDPGVDYKCARHEVSHAR